MISTPGEFAQFFDEIESRLTLSKSHVYRLDGKHIPGTTTMLEQKNKPGVNRWAVRVEREANIETAWKLMAGELALPIGDKKTFAASFQEASGKEYENAKQMKRAADIGSQLHVLVEAHLKEKLGIPFTLMDTVGDQARGMFNDSWLPWEKEVDLKPLFIERRGYHPEHWYAGTKDLGAYVYGERSIVDWKGKTVEQVDALYMEPIMQNVAYRKIMEALGLGVWTGHVVNIPREGGGKIVTHHIEPKPHEEWTIDSMFDAFLACKKLYISSKQFDKGKKW